MIKRFLCMLVLLLALALPAFGGHVKVSGAFCEGECTNGRCSACGVSCADGNRTASPGKDASGRISPGINDTTGPGLLMFALAFFIVYKIRS